MVKYGTKSVYADTPLGVILMGGLKQLLADLGHLPYANFSSKVNYPVSEETPSRDFMNKTFTTHVFKASIVESPIIGANRESYQISTYKDGFQKFSAASLEQECANVLNREADTTEDSITELDSNLVDYLLTNAKRRSDGRLEVPILWNDRVKHLLGQNYYLAKSVLVSNMKKHVQSNVHMKLMQDSISELENLAIIERVDNIESFVEENPSCSFMAHMQIFKLSKESTKCRTVFLSNLCEKTNNAISHNMAMHSGPPLNSKLTTSLTLLRFDKKCLLWDLKKAFCMLAIPKVDQNKLLFLWPKFKPDGTYDIVAYKNLRLPFGLRPSPTILMTMLYKMLILDATDDSEDLRKFKKSIYSLIYMDNAAITCDTSDKLSWSYDHINPIFNPYGFETQQFVTNDKKLQREANIEPKTENDLFGMHWDTISDVIKTKPFNLEASADTKRTILKTIAEVFDPFNFQGPLLNRARLFLHGLQCRQDLGWDDKLTQELCREWVNICNQINSSPPCSIARSMGSRQDEYELVVFSDSSKLIFGCTLYMHNLTKNSVHFVMAKNRIVNKQMEDKSIPSLELAAVVLGVETAIDVKNEISGKLSVDPVRISGLRIFSDSLCCLNWLNSYSKLDKMNKRSVFVKNRLDKINTLCAEHPTTFSFIDGINNHGDFITRPVSHKILSKSNYLTGPDFLTNENASMCQPDLLTVRLPYIGTRVEAQVLETVVSAPNEMLLNHERFSSFRKLTKIYGYVLKFVEICKRKWLANRPEKSKLHAMRKNIDADAVTYALKLEQRKFFPEVFDYFSRRNCTRDSIPNLVAQLNLFLDKEGLLRVGGKMTRAKATEVYFPVLIPKKSHVTNLIVSAAHEKLRHGGVYSVLAQLRKNFWIPCCFSTVQKVLRSCIHCRRFNKRTIKLNQSSYQELRLNPTEIPFSTVYADYIGPYTVGVGDVKSKVYVLCICCVYTRAINLKVSRDLSTAEFLRSLQLHVYEWGLMSRIISDLGSQLVAGGDIISNFLDDRSVKSYFTENNVSNFTVEHYNKGCSQLGSMIESCVKLTKRLLSSSVRNNVLDIGEFEFFVAEARHLVNRRPITFLESLRDCSGEEIPDYISPESLLFGRHLLSTNIIPTLQPVEFGTLDSDQNFDPSQHVKNMNSKFTKIRANLRDLYHSEYYAKLLKESVDRKGKYAPVTHDKICVNDLVLIKDEFCKPTNYPMARVRSVTENELGEITGAVLVKGNREVVKRHSSVIIPLLKVELLNSPEDNGTPDLARNLGQISEAAPSCSPRTVRAAAKRSEARTKSMLQ